MSNNGTPNPDQRARMVSDALKVLSHDFKPMDETAAMLLMKRTFELSKAVKAIIKPLLNHEQAFGGGHDTKTLAHIISKAYTEGFSNWDKDELLYLVVLMHTENAIEGITGETNSHKIIKI